MEAPHVYVGEKMLHEYLFVSAGSELSEQRTLVLGLKGMQSIFYADPFAYFLRMMNPESIVYISG